MNENGHLRHHFEFEDFRLYPLERLLTKNENRMALTPRVLDLLIVLVKSNGEVVSKEALMNSLWVDSFVEEGNISRTVSTLRKALGTQGNGSDFIETVPKIGYRFIAPVQETFTDAPEPVQESFTKAPEPVLNRVDQSNSKYLLLAAALVLIAGVGMYWYFSRTVAPQVGSDGLTNLTNNLADDDLPSWSPDGSKLAFTSNRDGMGAIYVMNSNGSGVTRLTSTSGREGAATWSPDGKKIAYDSERDANTEIYIADADGKNEIRLTINPTADAGPVSFSPDGKRIAFARNATGGLAVFNYDIYTMNTDGSDVKQLTTDPGYDAEPMWSPDGSQILFITDRLGNFEIFSINPDGSGEMNLSNSPGNDGAIGFTPDGQQIFCRSDTPDSLLLNQIYLIKPDGTNRRQISSFADKTYRISYSPQAKKFAFTTKKDGNFEIYTMDAANIPVN